jgi:threonylcarbamoyladenosine tRNA methylthiotransferase MtaB
MNRPMTRPVLHTLGCRLNAAEAEVMAGLAAAAGLGGAVVVNTCAVTAEAMRQARQDIRRLRRDHPGATLVVTGCAAQVEPAAFAAMPEVDHVIGNAEKLAPASWAALAAGGGARLAVGDIMALPAAPLPAAPLPAAEAAPRRARAPLPVQTGCDHRCTFCIIPFARGPSRSVPAAAVVAAVAGLADRGVAEVVLTGVDLTAWGADLPDRPRLGDLVRAILRGVPALPRLRISSIDALEADPALLAALAEEERLMPHLHLSLQHGHDLILKRMLRRHCRAEAIGFCETARRLRPDIAFGADLIAGFPTETEAQHAASESLIEACGLAFLHVFPFNPRPGTPAARMPQVRGEIAKDRAARLRAAGRAALARHLEARIGRILPVLVEAPGLARAADFTPVRLAPAAAAVPPGSLLHVTATGHDGTALCAAP